VALMAALTPRTPLLLMLALLAASGAFRSIGFTAYNTIAFADVEAAGLTDANTLSSAIQQAAVGLGAAAGALALRVAGVLDTADAYRGAFVIIAALFLFPLVETVFAPQGIGRRLTASAA